MARHAIAGYDLALPDPVTARPAICLNMMVRNASHIIQEVLDAVAPFISSWVIVDTGSDDGTQDLIRNHMASLGIPGELYERRWRDFGHNRTEALRLAQDRADYVWTLDAGDTLVGTPDFSRLGADIFWLRCVDDSGNTFWRAQLFRDGFRVGYESGVDEYAAWDNPHVDVRIEGEYHIQIRRGGSRNLDREQGSGSHRGLLLTESEGSPGDARSVFDLAQSYFEQGDYANAREWSVRRIAMGGPDEEVYAAMWMIAGSTAELGAPWLDVQDAYVRASDFRPTRAEPLYVVAKKHRVGQRYHVGYLFAERAAKIPLPERDTLFVHPDVYAWRATDELAVCASRIGKHAEAFTLCRRLLARPEIPDGDRQRIAGNRDFSAPAMIGAASSYPEALVDSLIAHPHDAEVTVTVIAGPDHTTTERTLNSFLHCCTDLSKIGRFLALDTGLPTQDRAKLQERYPFLEFADPEPSDGPGTPLGHLREQIHGRFWLHLGHGWQFFAPDNLITRLTAVLDAEPHVVQVGINFADAAKLTGASAPEPEIRRTPDTGRYVISTTLAHGPAMYDATRLDQSSGLDNTNPTPQTATLDEILCINAI